MQRKWVLPGNCPSGSIPFVKRVLGIEGDVVEVTHLVRLNGQLVPSSAVLRVDSQGLALPKAASTVLKKDQLWLGSNARGFDSRYFGPISTSLVKEVFTPLFLWEDF